MKIATTLFVLASLTCTIPFANAFDDDFENEFRSSPSPQTQRANAKSAHDELDDEFREFNQPQRQEAPTPQRTAPAPRETPRTQPAVQQAAPERERRIRTASIPQQSSSIVETKRAEGYDITLKSCKKIHNSIECELSAVDDEFDGGLLVYRAYRHHGESRMIDNLANVYSPNKLNVKDKETSGGYLEVLTLRNVPTEFTLNYENFSGKASTIHTLQIDAFNRRLNKKFQVKFFDVALDE